ncbi:MAG TPA: CoA-transferase [Sporichthyaceae bacterium]|jgi:glutaconate CoA-transferase subunit B|nr:CoA-transferase [Sporichthyaceae bacterium]
MTAAATGWTAAEMMTVAAARALRGGTCFVGIGKPSLAANLARHLHAPDLVLIYESGPIGAKPTRIPLSIGDGELATTADFVVGVAEMFNQWLQPGRFEVAFLGAAQIDRFANINTTVIGDYADPITRLPGAGGAPEIAAACGKVLVIVEQSPRAFTERVDFVTSFGFGDGAGCRERLGLRGRGPQQVITDLGVLEPEPVTCELVMTSLHANVTRDQVRAATGWNIRFAADLITTAPPSELELSTLRSLARA